MLDPVKLKENAITSIRLGIEDFQRSRAKPDAGGDPDRVLSSVRNIFAGVLLLFKYRIAISVNDPQNAHSLIFNPPEVLPHADGQGGIVWKPVGKFRTTTIDMAMLKKRFTGFGIVMDWSVIEKMQEERNHLEHLHPASGVGIIAGLVADLFPVLRDFITNELHEAPAVLLGDTWATMLAHHDFHEATRQACKAAWENAQVPENMQPILLAAQCPDCGSPLICPSKEDNDEGATVEDDDHRFVCMACDHRDKTVPLLEETLLEFVGGFDPYSGEEPPTDTCPDCDHETFVHGEAACFWCGYELRYKECAVCANGLSLDEQENHGLCGYHRYIAERERDR